MEQKLPERRQRISTLGEIGLQQFAPYLMNRIMGRYNATLREDFRKQGLTIPQVRTLAVLSVTDGVTVNDLSVYTVIEQSTLSRTLDTLCRRGQFAVNFLDSQARELSELFAGRIFRRKHVLEHDLRLRIAIRVHERFIYRVGPEFGGVRGGQALLAHAVHLRITKPEFAWSGNRGRDSPRPGSESVARGAG